MIQVRKMSNKKLLIRFVGKKICKYVWIVIFLFIFKGFLIFESFFFLFFVDFKVRKYKIHVICDCFEVNIALFSNVIMLIEDVTYVKILL